MEKKQEKRKNKNAQGGENTVSGHIWFQMPQIEIPFSVVCLECKHEFEPVKDSTTLLKCKCGHVITVKVMMQGQNAQDAAGARKMPKLDYSQLIRRGPPVG